MKHVPPPRGEPVSSPEANLATQTAQREKALKRLRKLRTKAADEIDRLLAFLDAVDDTDVDSQCEDNPVDDLETEPSLGWTDSEAKHGRYGDSWSVDVELDKCDDEPSLGSSAALSSSSQAHWAQGASDEREDMNEDGDSSWANTVDDEPSLASTATINQEKWSDGDGNDREQGTTRRFREEPKPASICNVTPIPGAEWKVE
jgi:hypothetical protein